MKKWFDTVRHSLTMRIFLITALILFSACAVTYLFIAWATPITYQSIATDALSEKADQLAAALQNSTLEDSGSLFDSFRMDTGADVTVIGEDGTAVTLPTSITGSDVTTTWSQVTITTSDTAVDTAVASDTEENSAEWSTDSLWGNSSVHSVAVTSSDWSVPFSFLGSTDNYQLIVTANITAVNQTAEAMGQVLPWLIAVILLISLFGSLFYSRYITKPIVRLSGISQKMAELDFSWQCEESRSDEIGILGQNLNELSQHLSGALSELKTANASLQADIDRERELERQRTAFFAAASHELKTPITVLRGQLSGMLAGVDVYQDRDKYLARSLAVTGRMEKLVQEMLTISRMENAGASTKQEPVDLSGLLSAQLALCEDLEMQRNQTVKAEIAPCVTVTGDEKLLGYAIMNLLTNALNYSPPGSLISVLLKADGTCTHLLVENSSVQIPEDALPHLFEAFYRVEASRSRESGGSGLGLYLTKMILDRHGASCRICNTDTGVSASISFQSPA